MYTIKNNIVHEIEIKKSRFICNLIKINDIKEVNNYLNQIKEEHKFSKHNCYAYIIGNNKKASDDKEPSGTAGVPMLNLLDINELTNVLAVVTRYFGGIKLGTGGLFKAYTTVLKEAIDKAEKEPLVLKYKYKIEFDYNKTKTIDYILKDTNIINKDFNDLVSYEFVEINDIDEILKNNDIKIITKEETY